MNPLENLEQAVPVPVLAEVEKPGGGQGVKTV